ncbi:MAG TPA: matrixin family metalloprotease [Chthoniobacterales bacterium]|nr:matrixin family metalloprotease [Chthoniobacterales bacterium]
MSRFGLLHLSPKALSLPICFRYKLPAMRRAVIAITLVVAALSTTAHAYVLQGPRWPSGTVLVLQLGLGSANRTLQDGNTSWDTAVEPVAEMWNQSFGRVRISNVFNPQAPVSQSDRINSVVFTNSIFGQSFGSGTLAVTFYTSSGSNMLEADTLFNRAAVFDSYRGPLQFIPHGVAIADIRRVFLHELGHSLGLGHPDQGGQRVTAVMNSIVSNQEELSSDDMAGGQYLYGAPVAPTPTPTPTPTAPPGGAAGHLANISTRMKVGSGQNVLIGGFIIQGSQPKTLILRAIGPSLVASGVLNVLANPVLELRDSAGVLVASNNDWQDTQASQIQQSGIAPTNALESAMLKTLAPGSYTAVVSGYDGGQGNGLIEAYEMDANSTRMVNISTRGRVGTADEPMIGGLIVQGGVTKRVIIRALGPSLAGGSSPVLGILADPILELRDGSGNLLAVNDDWGGSTQVNDILATTIPPVNALESAVVASLNAGNYTAIVRGLDNTSGVALVEVFDLDP